VDHIGIVGVNKRNDNDPLGIVDFGEDFIGEQ